MFDQFKNFNAKLEVAEKTVPAKKATKKRLVLPEQTGLTIRVLLHGGQLGKVYPSQELADLLNLEYTKDKSGNGVDICLLHDMIAINDHISNGGGLPNGLVVVSSAKSSPKLDLFANCKYDAETKEPTASVTKQGSKFFGEALLALAAKAYGQKIVDERKEAGTYIEFELVNNALMSGDLKVSKLVKNAKTGDHYEKHYWRRGAECFFLIPVTEYPELEEVEEPVEEAKPKKEVDTSVLVNSKAAEEFQNKVATFEKEGVTQSEEEEYTPVEEESNDEELEINLGGFDSKEEEQSPNKNDVAVEEDDSEEDDDEEFNLDLSDI